MKTIHVKLALHIYVVSNTSGQKDNVLSYVRKSVDLLAPINFLELVLAVISLLRFVFVQRHLASQNRAIKVLSRKFAIHKPP